MALAVAEDECDNKFTNAAPNFYPQRPNERQSGYNLSPIPQTNMGADRIPKAVNNGENQQEVANKKPATIYDDDFS